MHNDKSGAGKLIGRLFKNHTINGEIKIDSPEKR
jgi:hypothetical protein